MFLMHKNIKIARIDDNLNIIEIYNNDLMPLNCDLGKNIQGWINSRSIDNHRPTSRRLKRILRLKQTDIIVNNLISITDNWWILDNDNQNINYYDLKKYNETIAETIIQGISSKQIKVQVDFYCTSML
ncbi:MAG: hypothetical protein ACI4WH_07815 [Oscillospiraceae bacterium]